MNITLPAKEVNFSEQELRIISRLLHEWNLLLASVKLKGRTTGMLNSIGKQAIHLLNGNASLAFVHLSTQEDLNFSVTFTNDQLTNTDHYQRSEEMDKQSIKCNTIPYEDQYGIKELRKKQNQIGLDYRWKAIEKMKEDLGAYINPRSLGTLPETLTKETTMFRDQDCFNIPAPSPYAYGKNTVKSTQANIDLQVNMPPAKDPSETARNRLLERAGQASYEKRDEMRKAFNLIPDHKPETLKDFVQRIKDGKFVTDLTEKEQAERTFWNIERMLEEIEWRDPERKEDQAGFDAANELLTKALNDVSDEIIVKTPEAGLESLRAFQAKTFH